MKSQWKKNSSKISKVNIDEETALSTWMNTAVKGNISQKINTQLKELNLSQCGDIDFFLGCIHKEMKRVLGEEYTCVDIEAYINDQVGCSSILKSIMFIINEFEVNLKMISLNKDFKNFHYGERFSRKILLLHIGFKYFMPLSHGNVMDYEINEKDKKILENIYSEPQIICDGDIKAEKKLLKSLRKMLQGSECAQIIPDIPKRSDKKKAYYDLRPSKDLEADKDLKLCMFHMKNAHFATASIIVNGGKKEKDISLLNRKCCGYNTFEGDTVYVEINDPKSWTGKVVGVQNSNHKPINSLYICKICRDQGSLMIPLDGTFPKIHIDNEPGRRKYEKDMKNKKVKGGNCFKDEQKSNQMKLRENSRFADNIYVTVYEVNYEEKTKKVIFLNPRIVKIDPETCSKLFIVCYQYWDISMMYPSGRVVGVMSTYNCFQDTLHLLLPLCKVESLDLNQNYTNEIKKIKRSVNENQFLPRDIVPAGAMVFTIDDEDTEDMDDALSYHIEDQCTVVGVHITDITKYITPESEIYQQAKRKFSTSYMPKVLGKEPFYLLEKVLSTDVFSLVPNKSRAVLSVMFHFIKDDHRIQKVTFKETNIESKYKLNYKQVEQWIKEEERPSDVEEDLFIAIKECFKIAKQIRHSRLPDSYFVRQSNYCNPSFKFDDTFYANILIEEFMIMANEHVAKKIYEKYPNMNLIRIQEKVEDYEEWEKKLFEHSNINFASSLKQCCNLLNIRRSDESDKDLIMSLQFYKDFVYYLEEDLSRARNMLQYDEYIGEFYVHLCEWYDISFPARYERSVEGSVDNRHFSLNKKIYTHFTSPIRRFSDVIVHRLLKSVLNSNIDFDITDEIDEVSAIGNIKTKCNKLFEKRCVPYAIFESTPCVKSFILDCVCSNITNEELYFLHPFLRKSSAIKSVKFSHLSLNAPPVKLHANESSNFCELKWKKIIYSSDSLKSVKKIFVISSHLNDIKLSKDSWMLFREIRRSYLSSSKLEDKLKEIKKCFIKSEEREIITSNHFMDPIIEIKLKLYIKNTVKIQFCSYIVNGFKRVTPELMIIHPSFQLCLIHQEDPVMCFVHGGKLQLEHNDIILQFESVEQYKAYFTPLIQLETLKEILSENSEFTSDVLISWIHATYNVTHTKETFGIIKVSDSIFMSRNVDFHEENDKLEENLYNIIDKGLSSVSQDMLCLRSKRKDWDNYWIGHGSIVTVGKYQETDGSIVQVIVFILTHSDFDIFKDDHNDLVFTVEVYSLSISARRQLTVVAAIDKDDFLQKVILGLDIVSLEKDESILTQIWEELKRVKISNLNQKQKQAISNAMFKKLSLIWGPPGTGKTSIGCIIAYSYCLINKGRGHVIYCGPSNDSVNVVVDAMTKFFKNDCPKMLRVFSKKQELADFPLPGQVTRYKPLPENLHSTSLHHLIRATNNELSNNLEELDQKFKSLRNSSSIYHPKESVYNLIHKYKTLVEQAKKEYIKSNSFNLVLCTCSVSANSIMKYFEIKQVIIDEAGMCKEPETLLPIRSATKTLQNVVLIGDHKQLRPIILDDLASQRGLQISFFERYQLIKPELVTMLDQQYRMHPSICEFPSKYFYSNRLFTKASSKWSGLNHYDFQSEHCFNKWNGLDYSFAKSNYKMKLRDSGYSAIPDNKWPGQRLIPYISFKSKFNDFYPERLVFIHVVGEETVQSIATSTCGENSRANLLEVEAVGYIYDKLLKSLGNPLKAVKNITVLTQYRLQEDFLLSKCKEKINNIEYEPVVKTVIKSQGSENDYVIFSTVRSLRNKNDIIENPSPGWENKYLGFITDHNQVNVALTRARKGLIIIGNKNLLSVNKIWKSLLKDLENRKCILEDYKAFI